ncbi:MAG TPA: alpha/beta fold hydrolase [Pseudomonadales bacterium]|nr:alpha/beta fold hydrolase [Pseudomonadales bacterium]
MDQTIRFTKSPDGVRIAYAESGAGDPVVKAPNWLSHLEFDWQSPVWRHWFEFFSTGRRLLRLDARGCGLSDWTVPEFTLDAHVADLETVVDAAGVERFALLGISMGGPIAIEYARRHPRRVSHLILYGTSALGALRDAETAARARALFDLIPSGWSWENAAFRDVFASIYLPQGTDEQRAWFSDLLRITSKPEIAKRLLDAGGEVDVRARLTEIAVPTLVVHARKDAAIRFGQGREIAAAIPGARFVELDSPNHLLLANEPAWARFCEIVDEFLGPKQAAAATSACNVALASLTARERTVLEHIARGLSNDEIAAALNISGRTVRNHITNIFDKLGVDTRARAIVIARDAGWAMG